jgi:hypothetical protein
MSLGVFTSMVQWVKQLRIQTCQASEVLGIYLIGLTLVGVDEPYLARIGYQHLVAALLEQPTNPWRVSPRLDGDPQRPLRAETPPQSLRSGAQPTLLDHLAAFSVSIRHR